MNTKFHQSVPETSDEVCGTLYASKLLGLSVGSVQALVERNELDAWKTQGGHRRISMQSIRAYQRLHGKTETQHRSDLVRVLIVDDDIASLEMFKEAIASWHLPVDCTTMSSAVEAMIDISALRPDLLLTDLKMPGVDGFELLRTLRSSPTFASLIVVAMSGMSSTEIAEKGGVPPKTITLQKPLDMRWLHGFLSALAATRQLKTF